MLSKEDWQYVMDATMERLYKATPKPGEGKPSKAFLDQKSRIFSELYKLAHT